MDGRAEEKKQRLLGALEQGMAQLHVDPRRPGVLVPAQFRGDHHLVLNVSYRFDPPDLSVGDWGVRETLSFSGSRFTVAVPWSAVYAIASHGTREFWMYPDDMPVELVEAATARVNTESLEPKAPGDEESPRAILREVVMDKREEPPEEPTPPRRGHLRVVK